MTNGGPVSEERYGPLVHRRVHWGAILLLLGVVSFLLGNIVTEIGWNMHPGNPTYSLTQNYISDLGAVHCGEYAGRFICSPWHPVFNAGVVAMGLFLIGAAILLTTAFPNRSTRTIGLGLLVIAGIGAVGVGLSPEDVSPMVHTASAATAFVGGNVAIFVLGFAMFRDTRWAGFRAFSVICGLVGLVAFILLALKAFNWGPFFAAWGAGGMERTIIAPLLLWAVVVAIHLLRIRAFAPRMVPGVGAI